MNKTATMNMRIDPAVKAALEKAAEMDSRSASAMAETILAEWLKTRGYLKR